MSVPEWVHPYFVPSKENAYRPHLLRRSWILFFVAVIFVSEGMFVSSLFVGQGGAVPPPAAQTVAAVGATSVASHFNSYTQSLGRQFVRFATETRPMVPYILGLVALLTMAALAFTFFVHIQIQQHEMLFSGTLVALFAVSLIVTNAQIVAML